MPLDPAIPPAIRPPERSALRFAELERRIRTVETFGSGGSLGSGISASLFDVKGDLLVASADNSPARLGVGANGFMIAADSAQSLGMKWTNNLSLPDSGTGPRIFAAGSQQDTVTVLSTRSNGGPSGNATFGVDVAPTTLCTDTADPLTFVQGGVMSYCNYGDATHAAVGTAHAGTFWHNIIKSGNATSEHVGLGCYLVYNSTVSATPGRAWMFDGGLHGAIGVRQDLLQGASIFMNNYYNGQPIAGDAMALVISTKAGDGAAATAAHAAALTYPIADGIAILGTASGGTGHGFLNAIRLGGGGSGWSVAGSHFAVGIYIGDYDTAGVQFGNRWSGSTTAPAMIFNDGAGDIQFGTTTGVKVGTATTQKMGFWNATPVVRPTGWGAPTGTATRTTFDTTTVTLANLAQRVKALIDDLTTIGLIGA